MGISALDSVKDLVEPGLRAAVEKLNPKSAECVKYHFGWIDAEGNPTDSTGKGIRPALALKSAEFVGADQSMALPGAIAVELVHNFSLLHDDIIDNDARRRHRLTVWKVFGVNDALIAGDALLALAFQELVRSGSKNTLLAISQLAEATAEMIGGQHLDMAIEENFNDPPTLRDCQEMEAQKTGALLACSASIGATLAEGKPAQIKALQTYGMELGLAFQAVDDLLGIWGDPQVTGKPAGNDIREKKRSVPIVLALESKSRAAEQISKIMAKKTLNEKDIQSTLNILESENIYSQTQELANKHLKKALQAIDGQGGAPGATKELMELAHFVVERNY